MENYFSTLGISPTLDEVSIEKAFLNPPQDRPYNFESAYKNLKDEKNRIRCFLAYADHLTLKERITLMERLYPNHKATIFMPILFRKNTQGPKFYYHARGLIAPLEYLKQENFDPQVFADAINKYRDYYMSDLRQVGFNLNEVNSIVNQHSWYKSGAHGIAAIELQVDLRDLWYKPVSEKESLEWGGAVNSHDGRFLRLREITTLMGSQIKSIHCTSDNGRKRYAFEPVINTGFHDSEEKTEATQSGNFDLWEEDVLRRDAYRALRGKRLDANTAYRGIASGVGVEFLKQCIAGDSIPEITKTIVDKGIKDFVRVEESYQSKSILDILLRDYKSQCGVYDELTAHQWIDWIHEQLFEDPSEPIKARLFELLNAFIRGSLFDQDVQLQILIRTLTDEKIISLYGKQQKEVIQNLLRQQNIYLRLPESDDPYDIEKLLCVFTEEAVNSNKYTAERTCADARRMIKMFSEQTDYFANLRVIPRSFELAAQAGRNDLLEEYPECVRELKSLTLSKPSGTGMFGKTTECSNELSESKEEQPTFKMN